MVLRRNSMFFPYQSVVVFCRYIVISSRWETVLSIRFEVPIWSDIGENIELYECFLNISFIVRISNRWTDAWRSLRS